MTDFNGVRRRTLGKYCVLYKKPRKIVVSLNRKGDLITFRESGRRQAWSLCADTAFKYAVRLAAFAAAAQKRSRKEK